jgi:hypothetical protein
MSETIGLAHEIWAAAQTDPGEGIEDAVSRIEAMIVAYKRSPLVWNKCSDRMPEPGCEVLVWKDSQRWPAWRNSHALVAYLDSLGDWWEERHPSHQPLIGVIAWAEIDIPE